MEVWSVFWQSPADGFSNKPETANLKQDTIKQVGDHFDYKFMLLHVVYVHFKKQNILICWTREV